MRCTLTQSEFLSLAGSAEVWSHDIAKEPGTGWASIPLGRIGAGSSHKIVVAVRALEPDAGAGWGDAARTTFQLIRP